MKVQLKKQGLYLTLGLFVVSFLKAMGMGSSDTIYFLGMILSLGCAIIQIIFDSSSYTIREVIGLLIFFALTVVNLLIIKDITLFITFFFFVAMRKVSLRQILKTVLLAKIVGFLTNFILVFLGLKISNVVQFYRDGFVYRTDFGFGHANTFHFIYASIIVLYFLLYYSKIKWWHISLTYLCNELIYYFSLSRTGYYNVMILILLYVLLKGKLFKKLFFSFSRFGQLFFCILSYLLAVVFYYTDVVQKLNVILTGRVTFSRLQYSEGISLLGNYFDVTQIFFDNSYSMIVTQYGILLTLLILFFYDTSLKFLIEHKLESLVLFMSIMSIYMFTESYLPSAIVNLTWLLMSKVYFGETDSLIEEFS